MKLISFSLYGNKEMYAVGIKENVRLAKEVYPNWNVRVYHSGELPEAFWKELPCQKVNMGKSLGDSGMFWRFLPAFEKTFTHVIFRDADSRLNVREAVAVNEWLKSGKKVHCMHDHEHHRCLPIFGGMWGVKAGSLSHNVLRKLQRHIKREQKRMDDMIFLERVVLPEVYSSICRHSSFPVKWPGFKPFPIHPEYHGFVGQQFKADGTPIR